MASSISFPDMFNYASGKVKLVEGDLMHRQSLKSILLTNIGELLGDPLFGSDIKSTLFDLNNSIFKLRLQQKISEAATQYVKHISINSDGVNIEIGENNEKAIITINYYDKTSGQPDILQLVVLSNGTLTTI